MKNYLIYPILLLFVSTSLFSQTALLKGKIIDAETKEGLPFATIQVPNTLKGTVSNVDGFFEIKLTSTESSIKVSYIGYEEKEVLLGKKRHKLLEVKLKSSAVNLAEVIVRSKSPLAYIQEAVEKHPSNISNEPFSSRGFFSEKSVTANDNTNSYGLGEAVFQSYFKNYADTSENNQNQLALYRYKSEGDFRTMLLDNKRLNKKGKEKTIDINNTSEEEEEADINIDVEGMSGGGPKDVLDIARSVISLPFLDANYFKKFKYSFGENSIYQDKALIVVDFVSKGRIDMAKYEGSIYLDYTNLAIVAVKYKETVKVPFYINMLISGVAGFKIGEIHQEVSIQNQVRNETWYPKELIKTVDLTLIQKGQEELLKTTQIFNIDEINIEDPTGILKDLRFDPSGDYEEQVKAIEGLNWEDVNVVKQD